MGIWEKLQKHKSLFTGVFLVLPIIIALLQWLYPINFEKRDVTFSLISHIERLNLDDTEDIEKVKVFFDGQEIFNLSYTKYRIFNTGTLPIAPQDYIENLIILLPDGVNILNAKIEPSSIMNGVVKEGNKIVLDKDLINPEEFFDIEITSSGLFDPLEANLEGRVVGVSHYELSEGKIMTVAEERELARSKLKGWGITALVFFIAILLMIIFFHIAGKFRENKTFKKVSEVSLVMFVIIYVGFFIIYIGYYLVWNLWAAFIA